MGHSQIHCAESDYTTAVLLIHLHNMKRMAHTNSVHVYSIKKTSDCLNMSLKIYELLYSK